MLLTVALDLVFELSIVKAFRNIGEYIRFTKGVYFEFLKTCRQVA